MTDSVQWLVDELESRRLVGLQRYAESLNLDLTAYLRTEIAVRDELRAEIERLRDLVVHHNEQHVQDRAKIEQLQGFLKYVYGAAQDHDDFQLMTEIDKVLD